MRKSILRKPKLPGIILPILLCVSSLKADLCAQSPVQQFIANYVSVAPFSSYSALPASPGTFSGCVGSTYSYTWGNGVQNQLKLTSFTANGKTYVVAPSPAVTIKLRRVNNAVVTGNRSILYSESMTGPVAACPASLLLEFKAPYNNDMASFLNNYILNHGTDNIFTNASNGDGNNNNIERVDVIFGNGIATAFPTEAGFILCERGNNNAHDGFRIAAILSVNASGDPTSFGAVKTCVAGNGSNNGSWGHPSLANGNKSLSAYVLRKDPADTYLRVSSNVNQEMGGVFFSLTDLGVSAGQTVYGYILIGPDGVANPSSAQLLNTSDATVFPTATTEVQGGGMDLVSINTFFGTNQALATDGVQLFKGSVINHEGVLNWILSDLNPGTTIILERSDQASFFTPILSYKNDGPSNNRTHKDAAGTGTWYYRLRIVPLAGRSYYSPIVQLQINDPHTWRLYPSLLKAGDWVTVEGLDDGQYSGQFHWPGGGWFIVKFRVQGGKALIETPAGIVSTGMYYLLIEKNGKTIGKAHKIIIRN